MITRKMEDKFEELKSYFNDKLVEQEERITKTFNDLINDLKKEMRNEIQNEVSKQCEKLDSENKMLKKQVSELRNLNIKNQVETEDLEQYGRRLCLRIDGVPTVQNESSEEVLENVKSLFTELKVEIPDTVLDRAHRIGPSYMDKVSNKNCKSIIVRFTTFRHRTMFYRVRKNLRKGIKVKLDLTKSRFNLLKQANDHVKDVPAIKFCYADVNCRLRVKFRDEREKDSFFSSFEELCEIVDLEV